MATLDESKKTAVGAPAFHVEGITAIFPIGTVIPYAGKAEHGDNRARLERAGWLVCNGDPIDRTKYRLLYQVIGDIHGRGDATTTFNLPDYRGRFLRGVDSGVGRDPDAATRKEAASGGLTGDNVGSVQPHAFSSHAHKTTIMVHNDKIDGVDSALTNSYEHRNDFNASTGLSGESSETRPINANVFWLILAFKAS